MITVRVNGEERSIEAGRTIVDLLEDLGLEPRLIVVEYNREIVGRERYRDIEIRAGDSLELVHFVGGG